VLYRGIYHESLEFSRYPQEPLGECIYQENSSDKGIFYGIPGEQPRSQGFSLEGGGKSPGNEVTRRRIVAFHTTPYKHNQCAAHDGKVGSNTVEVFNGIPDCVFYGIV